ncbi:MAG: acyltransferase family protein, partial [Planctomycetia bacterium]
GTGTMLKNRAARILIPFLISVVTIIPLDKVVGLFALLANASHPQDPIFKTILQGDSMQLLHLLEKGPNALLEEPEKRMRFTPLNWAVLCGSEPITKLLLERGSNPMAINRNGYNSLYMAALIGRVDLLKLLIENGGDPFHAGGLAKSAWAAAHQSYDETRTTVLISKGKFSEDITALNNGRQAVIEFLKRFSMDKYGTPSPPEQTSPPKSMEGLPGWMQQYFEWLASDQNVVSIAGQKINLLQDASLEHLWFLWFLWWLCVIHYILDYLCHPNGPGSTYKISLIYPGLLVAFVLTCFMQAWMTLDYFPKVFHLQVGPDFSPGLIPKPHVFLYYAVFFFFGSWYFRLGDNQCFLGRYWRLALPVAMLVLFPLVLATKEQRFLNTLLQSLYTWLMVLGSIGLANRLVQRESKLFRYVADSSYWLYLTHIPLVVCMQWLFLYLPVPAWVKFTMGFLVTMLILFASYEWMVRHTIIGRILNGKKK